MEIIEEYASGKDIDGRPKFKDLIERAELPKRSRGFDAIMCLRLDRFTRSVIDGLTTLEKLSRAGCDLIFVHEKYDTTTPMGRMFVTCSLSWAQMYREDLSDKVAEGIVRWERENPDKNWGRQIRSDVDLRLALALLNGDGENKLSLRRTAEKLGLSVSTLSDHLSRAGYVRDKTNGVYGIPGSEKGGPIDIPSTPGEVSGEDLCSEQTKDDLDLRQISEEPSGPLDPPRIIGNGNVTRETSSILGIYSLALKKSRAEGPEELTGTEEGHETP